MPLETYSCEIANKMCKCHVCGRVECATFGFDYYPHDDKGPDGHHYLMCERCMMNLAFAKEKPKPPPPKPGYAIESFNVDNMH